MQDAACKHPWQLSKKLENTDLMGYSIMTLENRINENAAISSTYTFPNFCLGTELSFSSRSWGPLIFLDHSIY